MNIGGAHEQRIGLSRRRGASATVMVSAAMLLSVSLAGGCQKLMPNGSGTGATTRTAQEAPETAPAASHLAADIAVPDVIGVKEHQARQVVEALKLDLEVTTGSSASTPPGLIISQSPAKETLVRRGATVKIRISTGPADGGEAVRTTRTQVSEIPSSPPRSRRVSPPAPAAPLTSASYRVLSESDLYGRTGWELTLLRNELYARNGYRFQRTDLRSHFNQFIWYQPDTSDMNVVTRRLSSVERRNADFIRRYQERNGLVR